MTFRRPLRDGWPWPLSLSGSVLALWALWPLALPVAGLMYLIARRSVAALGFKITLDGDGVRWPGTRLAWEEIGRLDVLSGSIALLEKADERPHALPFITPALYRVLRERLNPLSPFIERKVLGDTWR